MLATASHDSPHFSSQVDAQIYFQTAQRLIATIMTQLCQLEPRYRLGIISLYRTPHVVSSAAAFLKSSSTAHARVEIVDQPGKHRSPWSPTASKRGVRMESNLNRDGIWRPNGVHIKGL
jgi:hypothetical protein